MINTALAYADRGVHVFPCKRKIPLCPHGVLDATTDEDQIRAWWDRRPNANIGIAAGASRFVIVDLDRKHDNDGLLTLEHLERELGALPPTLTASTPNHGEHRYFQAPANVVIRPRASKVGDTHAPGIDIRAAASYVIAPPSTIDGKTYEWTLRHPIAELPLAWIEALRVKARPEPSERPVLEALDDRRVTRYCMKALEGRTDELAETPRGQRNERLYAAAAYLAGLTHYAVFGRDEVAKNIEWACSQWGERQPWKDKDTFERAFEWGQAHPISVDWGSGATT